VEVVRFVRCEDFLGGGHFHPALWAGFMWLWGDVLCEAVYLGNNISIKSPSNSFRVQKLEKYGIIS